MAMRDGRPHDFTFAIDGGEGGITFAGVSRWFYALIRKTARESGLFCGLHLGCSGKDMGRNEPGDFDDRCLARELEFHLSQ